MERKPTMSKKIIVITGASSGFGRLTANALAKAGHPVYASKRDTAGRNTQGADVKKFARDNAVHWHFERLAHHQASPADPTLAARAFLLHQVS
jgi:NAD(P)-dependent dehydrogenase (short-subunit alcohol dehydrogenase family)